MRTFNLTCVRDDGATYTQQVQAGSFEVKDGDLVFFTEPDFVGWIAVPAVPFLAFARKTWITVREEKTQ